MSNFIFFYGIPEVLSQSLYFILYFFLLFMVVEWLHSFKHVKKIYAKEWESPGETFCFWV